VRLFVDVKTGLYLGVKHMDKKDREKVIEEWENKKITVIVATEAFGLGVDYIFRNVINWGLPFTIESLWQRAGRAGRDGKAAKAMVFWSWQDITDLNWVTKAPKVDNQKTTTAYMKVLK